MLPPVWRAWEHVPSNFHGSTLAGAVQIWDVLRVYTFPARQAGIFVDHEMLPLFPASTRQAFAEAGENAEHNGGRKRAGPALELRTLLSEMVLCSKLRRPYCGYSILCSCPYFCTRGSCAHHFLRISEYVAKGVSPTRAGAEEALRQLPRSPLPDPS